MAFGIGPQGFQGFTGKQGYRGFQGDRGNQGRQGFQGAAGRGAQGFQGNQGGSGSQGFQGSPGTGSQGAQGFQGAAGTGNQGAQGAQGAAGTGSQGFQGNQGFQGQQGNQGFQGAAGTGSQGAQGAQGAAGGGGGGGGLLSFTYTYDSSSSNASGMTTGQMRLIGNLSDATALHVTDTDAAGNQFETYYNQNQIRIGSIVTLRKDGSSTVYAVARIVNHSAGSTTHTFGIAVDYSRGSITNGDTFSVTFEPSPAYLGDRAAFLHPDGSNTYGVLGNMARPYASAQAAWDAGARHFVLAKCSGGQYGDLTANGSAIFSMQSLSEDSVNLGISTVTATNGGTILIRNVGGSANTLGIHSAIANGTVVTNQPQNAGNIFLYGLTLTAAYAQGVASDLANVTYAGSHGGTIELYDCRVLSSVYVSGGAGPSGANMSTAPVGGNAGYLTLVNCEITANLQLMAVGGNGGNSSQEGTGASGGLGGNGGTIALRHCWQTNDSLLSITVNATGGIGGQGGPGDMYNDGVGNGGNGGQGGSVFVDQCSLRGAYVFADGGSRGLNGNGNEDTNAAGGSGGTLSLYHSSLAAAQAAGGASGELSAGANGGALTVKYCEILYGLAAERNGGSATNGAMTVQFSTIGSAVSNTGVDHTNSYYNVIAGTAHTSYP